MRYQNLLIGLLWLNLCCLSNAQTAHIAIGEWLPFTSAQHRHNGVLSHIVYDVLTSQGIKVRFGFYPWSRAFNMVETHSADISIGWSHSVERDKQVLFSQSLMVLEDVFYFRKEDVRSWNKVTDFSGQKIGVTKSFYYGEEFSQAQKAGAITTSIAKDDISNFKMLLSGRIDVFPIVRVSALATLKQHFKAEEVAQLAYHPKPVKEVSYRVIFSRSERGNKLLNAFDKGLQEFKDSGRYQQYWDLYQQGFYQQ